MGPSCDIDKATAVVDVEKAEGVIQLFWNLLYRGDEEVAGRL